MYPVRTVSIGLGNEFAHTWIIQGHSDTTKVRQDTIQDVNYSDYLYTDPIFETAVSVQSTILHEDPQSPGANELLKVYELNITGCYLFHLAGLAVLEDYTLVCHL